MPDLAMARPTAAATGRAGRPRALLYLDNVTVSFDGFKALDGLSLIVDEGELRTVIGPNGAGKTTFLDVVTGKSKPDNGIVFFKDTHDLTRLDEATIANLGIGRKFQKPTVFDNLTVAENLELARKARRGILRMLLAPAVTPPSELMEAAVETIGLAGRRETVAGNLSHGQKQWLEIGMLLVQDQELLLLDEPVAGMTDSEREQTAALIRGIAGERTVVVVEHDMQFVRSLEGRVTVLHEGRMLMEGSMDAVESNATVADVYLGR